MKTSTCRTKLDGDDTKILSTIPTSCAILPTMLITKPSKSTLPYPHPLNEHSTQYCSLHSLPHNRQSISAMSSSNKISQHKLHSNMLYRPSTAHALYSFYVCTRQTISAHAVLSSNYIAVIHNIYNSVFIHRKMSYTPRTTHPPAFTTLLCTPLIQNLVGKMAQDVGMVESIVMSHLVWLVLEDSIPTCACFHSENIFMTLYLN